MSSIPPNDKPSSSKDKDNKTKNNKHQIENVTVTRQEAQYAKPTAIVQPKKRKDFKPMFPKPSGSQNYRRRLDE
jgi:hypothetical protein